MEEYQDEIMNARSWIEFGKMFNAMASEGWEVEIESYTENDNLMYSCLLYDNTNDILYNEGGLFKTPYAAIKHMYYTCFIDSNYNDISLDLDDDLIEDLYLQSDREGITVDEYVCKILSQVLETPQEEVDECCGNCFYITPDEYCTHLRCSTSPEYTCLNFVPK